MGIANFVGPLMVLPFSKSLTAVVTVIMVFRFLAWAAHIRYCISVFPALVHCRVEREAVRPLFALGGWMTVSNVLNPLLISSDRFMIGAIVSVTAVAYYATPYEMMTRALVIPGALTGVLFPAFSTSSIADRGHTCTLFAWATKIVYMCMFPLALIFVMFGGYGLRLWLGAEFSAKSTHILQIFAINVFLSSLGLVAFVLIQAAGRPDITAKINMLELVAYLPIAWLLIHARGIEGAAWAWFGRVVVDTFILFVIVRRLFPGTAALVRRMGIFLAATIAFLLLLTASRTTPTYAVLLVAIMAGFAIVGWLVVLVPHERVQLRKYWIEKGWVRLVPSFLRQGDG
jgi:O-antigen/teichoic acid export membrane protein